MTKGNLIFTKYWTWRINTALKGGSLRGRWLVSPTAMGKKLFRSRNLSFWWFCNFRSLLPSGPFSEGSAQSCSGCTRKTGGQLPSFTRSSPLDMRGSCRLQTSGVCQKGGEICSCCWSRGSTLCGARVPVVRSSKLCASPASPHCFLSVRSPLKPRFYITRLENRRQHHGGCSWRLFGIIVI